MKTLTTQQAKDAVVKAARAVMQSGDPPTPDALIMLRAALNALDATTATPPARHLWLGRGYAGQETDDEHLEAQREAVLGH